MLNSVNKSAFQEGVRKINGVRNARRLYDDDNNNNNGDENASSKEADRVSNFTTYLPRSPLES